MSPVYWKPKYATRNKLHRTFVRRQAVREATLRSRRTSTIVERVRRLLGFTRAD